MKIIIDLEKLKKSPVTITDFVLFYLIYEDTEQSIQGYRDLAHKVHPYKEHYITTIQFYESIGVIKITGDLILYNELGEEYYNPNAISLRDPLIELYSYNVSKLPNLLPIAEELRNMFPPKIRSGSGALVKSSLVSVVDKLKKFYKFYPDTKEEDIIKATSRYIENRRKVNWAYISELRYFIFKDSNSILAAEIDALADNEEINVFDIEA